MAQARYAFDKAFSLNPEALRSMAANIRTLEEAVSTERRLRQQTRQDAQHEADTARQRATDALLNALSAVRRASSHVSRELEEARRTAAIAENLNESSQDDLERAQAMMSEAEARMREEAQKLLGQSRGSSITAQQENAASSRPRGGNVRARSSPRGPSPRPRVFRSGVDREASGRAPGRQPAAEGGSSPSVDPRISPSRPSEGESRVGPEPGAFRADGEHPLDRSQGRDVSQQPSPSPQVRFGQVSPTPPVQPPPVPEGDAGRNERPHKEETTASPPNMPADQERPPGSMDRARVPATADLEAALNEFLRSTEVLEQASTEGPPQGSSRTTLKGLLLDNLDLSKKQPARAGQALTRSGEYPRLHGFAREVRH